MIPQWIWDIQTAKITIDLMPVYLLNSEYIFPDPADAEDSGLLAIGGDLSPERLILAYEMGIFPWYSEDDPILWFSPDPRMIMDLYTYRPGRSLQKVLNSAKFEIRIDTDFPSVIEHCARISRNGQTGTWITGEMIEAYNKLHVLGYAHSFETYFEGELAGGLYGVSLGGAFFGESMFYLEKNTSKVAFHHLVLKCREMNFDFIDSQVPTEHMKKLGCYEVSRKEFLKKLGTALKKETIKGKWK